jgi:hypothetical protein
VVLSLASVTAAAVLQSSEAQAFRNYFGSLPPWVATAVVVTLGAGALVYLETAGWFAVRGAGPGIRGLLVGGLLAAGFTVPVIVIDFLGGFSRDMNVLAPQSLVFYPLMAVVAESAFHAVPLGVLLLLSARLLPRVSRLKTKRSAILLVALIEPTLQTIWASPETPSWVTAYVGIHVFAINLTVLYLFSRFDFLTAYGFRGLYYLGWHIVWGALRISLVFGGEA